MSLTVSMIHQDNIPFLEKVLKRDHLDHVFFKEGGETKVAVDSSYNYFRKVVLKDMCCEKQSEEYGGIPVYSLETLRDPRKRERLSELSGSRSYIPLRQDAKKICEEFLID